MTQKLSNYFNVKGRFHRSVQIEHDLSVDGYILTQSGMRVIKRILNSLKSDVATRAWSLIGPYGSGKSAFVVFLKSLLSSQTDIKDCRAHELLKKEDKRLYNSLFEFKQSAKKGYCCALVSAGREKLEYSILKGLRNGINSFASSRSKKALKILSDIEKAIKKCEKGKIPSNDELLLLCDNVISYIKSAKGAGLLLVVDELGKTLETAAMENDHDIFILQKLAEKASRTTDIPFLFFTVLHQSFEKYASKLDIESRNEWSKVQGRFEDLSFIDSSDQIYKLISSAISQTAVYKKEKKAVEAATANIFKELAEIFSFDLHRSSKRFINLIKSCLPMHPFVVIVLIPLFRSKFSQNERSLFAFITSTEPGGFVDYLSKMDIYDNKGQVNFFSLHHLYDYLITNVGLALFAQHQGRRWVEIDNALSRSRNELERKIIKTIGMLSLLGESLGLSVNEEVLSCALNLKAKEKGSLKEALGNLKKKSVIVFRKHSSSYVIWGGSDIDIEEKITEGVKHVLSDGNFIEKLNFVFPLRPKVAKRHLFEKGTLRYFKLRYIAYEDLESELDDTEIQRGDGQILFVLNFDQGVRVKEKGVFDVLNSVKSQVSNRTLVAIAQDAKQLKESFVELLAMRWIKKNTPELQGDRVARRELEARIVEMERAVLDITEELFFPVETRSNHKIKWLDRNCKGKAAYNITKRRMSEWISDICDKVYSKTPIIKNELINRDRISATISSARRKLTQAIVEKSDQLNLGIEGYPPEFAVYQSIYKSTNMHLLVGKNSWKFTRLAKDIEKSWRPLWRKISSFLQKNSDRKVKLLELHEIARKEPFGLRKGVIPLLLIAVFKAYEEELAIFKEGTFLPKLSSVDYEIMLKMPQAFEVQLCLIEGIKADVFEEIIRTFIDKSAQDSFKKKATILHIVKMFCDFATSLPTYVKNTETVSDKTKAVRRCLLEAKEPANLLYRDLPKACGFEPISEKKADILVDDFISVFKSSIKELQRKKDELFQRIESLIFNAFNIKDSGEHGKIIVINQAKQLLKLSTLDDGFRIFLNRVVDDQEYMVWINSIATMVSNRPPLAWSDKDFSLFEQNMDDHRRNVKKYYSIAVEIGTMTGDIEQEISQLIISSNKHSEKSRIVNLDKVDKAKVERIYNIFEENFGPELSRLHPDYVLAAISQYARDLINVVEQKQQKISKRNSKKM